MDYYKSKAIGSTDLKNSFNGLDYLLLETEYKPYFEFGKVFENYIQEEIQGTEHQIKFVDVKTIPKDIDYIVKQIKNGAEPSGFYNKKDGTLDKRKSSLKTVLDYYEATGDIPITEQEMNVIYKMAENVFKTPVINGLNLKAMNKLNPLEFQKEYFALIDNVEVRAKFDIIWRWENTVHTIDLKTTAGLTKFKTDLRYGGFWQGYHYDQIIKQENENFDTIENMIYLVSSKAKPYLSQVVGAEYTTEYVHEIYLNQLHKIDNWRKNGSYKIGYLEPENVNISYIKI